MAVKRKRRVAKRRPARKRRALSASVVATLKRKAKNSRYTYGQLASVFRRGQGAFLSSGSRIPDVLGFGGCYNLTNVQRKYC